MNRTRIAITVAAVLAAAPAFAQTASSSVSGTARDPQSGAMSSSTQKAATPRNKASQAQRAAADQGRVPLCSELGQPNAGKLADKTTGMAQDNSASAVHMDCLPDGSTSASAATGTNVAKNGTMSNSTNLNARTNGSVTGSASAGTSNSTSAGTSGAKTPSSNTGR